MKVSDVCGGAQESFVLRNKETGKGEHLGECPKALNIEDDFCLYRAVHKDSKAVRRQGQLNFQTNALK
eukprot:6602677-Ditylum_brightwellii.AAC.1